MRSARLDPAAHFLPGLANANVIALELVVRSLVPGVDDDTRSVDVSRNATTVASAESDSFGRNEHLPRGTALGRYLVLDVLGEGGMGVVYTAYDPELDRRIAVKLLRSSFWGTLGRERVLREAQTMARLEHPNVVRIYDVGTLGEQVFIAMELVEGVTLRDWLAAQPRSWREVIGVMLGVGRGLAAAHDAGVVHRDIKPSNIIVTPRDQGLVLDFGVAAPTESGPLGGGQGAKADDDATDTEIVGTPAYMAPEQRRGQATAHSDQYSYCLTLYEALTGLHAPTLAGDTKMSTTWTRENHPNARRGPIAAGRVPRSLRRAVHRGLAFEADQRHPDMASLLKALDPPADRRTIWLAAALLAITVAVSAAWLASPRAADPLTLCMAGAQAGERVWSDAARDRVRAQFAASDRSYAADTARRVIALVDARAGAWRDGRDQACAATWRSGTQSEVLLDRRMQCLSRRLGELESLVELYTGTVDGPLIDGAVQALLALPPIADCADVERLAASYPEPATPAAAAQVAALRERIDDAQALRLAGRFDTAVEAGLGLVADAEAEDYPPVAAHALFELGMAQAEAGKASDAEASLARAMVYAARAHDDRRLAVLGARRIWAVGYMQDRGDEAMGAAPLVEAAVIRAGDEPLLRAELDGVLGAVHLAKGRNAEARVHLERTAATYQDAFGPDDPRMGTPLNNLGLLHQYDGDFETAIDYLQRARDAWEAGLGADHPSVAIALNNLGMALSSSGRSTEARAAYERALAIWESALGPAHPDVATVLVNLGVAASQEGHLTEAQTAYERSLAIAEARLGPKHQQVGIALQNVGAILAKQGKYADALPYHRRALTIFEASLGPEHPFVAAALMGLASALRETGDPAAAIPLLERAVAAAATGASDALADIQFELARVLWEASVQRKRALELARAARDALATADTDEAVTEYLDEIDAWIAARGQRAAGTAASP